MKAAELMARIAALHPDTPVVIKTTPGAQTRHYAIDKLEIMNLSQHEDPAPGEDFVVLFIHPFNGIPDDPAARR